MATGQRSEGGSQQPGHAGSPRSWERRGKASFLEPPEGGCPANSFISFCGPPEGRENVCC